MKIKATALSFLPFAAASLFAQIDPGIHTGTISDTSLNRPSGADASWTFNDATFSNDFAMKLEVASGYEHSVTLNNSMMTFKELYLQGAGTNTMALYGTDDATRTSVTVSASAGDWIINIKANGNNKLSLNGYSDITYKNFKIASDANDVVAGGSGGVSITGASNRFVATGSSYINHVDNIASGTVFFDISGLKDAKSSATFNSLVVRAAGESNASVNMKGEAVMNVGGLFNFGEFTKSGTASFTISGSGNEFYSTAGGNGFLVGSDFTGGVLNYTISGKSNKVSVAGVAWIGSEKAGSGKVNFTVKGSGHDIVFASAVNFRGKNGNSVELIFAADKTGFSTLNANAITMFDGDFSIDLTDFLGDDSGTYSISLISANNDWNALASRFLGNSADGNSDADVKMGSNGLSWTIEYDDGDLVFTYNYTPVPEPAAYAAIFGALALAFAAYRRRR